MASPQPPVPEELQHLVIQFIRFCREEALLLDGVDLQKTRVITKQGHLLLQLPYVDRHRRPLRIDVSQDRDGWRLSDGGRIVTGCEGASCRWYLSRVLQWYGLVLHRGSLILKTPATGFAGRLSTFIRVLRTIDHLIRSQTAQAA